LKWELGDMYPLIEVPDLLMEVHTCTGFADWFTHIRTKEPPRSIPAILAGVLADATNLGVRHIAAASIGVSPQTMPPWLLAMSYAPVGWSIGLHFTRPILAHAARALPRVIASVLVLIADCGLFAAGLVVLAGEDSHGCSCRPRAGHPPSAPARPGPRPRLDAPGSRSRR
jgi:hypothetical protein